MSRFPRKVSNGMTPSQAMGHHSMLLQQGLSREMIASSMVSLSGLQGQQPEPATSSRSFAAEGVSSLVEDTLSEKQRAVVENALQELASKNTAARQETRAKEKEEEEKRSAGQEEKKLKCFLHKKPNKNCKKCQADLNQQAEKAKKKEAEEVALTSEELLKKQDEKKEVRCSPMLKEQIVNCSYFKRLLDFKSVDSIIGEILDGVDTIDVYKPGSKISPSSFVCHVYRLSVFQHIENDLDLLIENRQHAVLRCVGLLYIRFVTPPMQLWDMLEEYLLDDMQLSYNHDGQDSTTTIGEYVEGLLTQEKYFDSPLPRLPVKVKQMVEEKVAPMLQHRKRMEANRRAITSDNIEDLPVEVCMDGTWMKGTAKGFAPSKVPSRVKVKVRLESGVDVKVHLGKVVIDDGTDGAPEDGGRHGHDKRHRGRSRSRSRSRGRRGSSPDWSRWKGKSDSEMIQELRDRHRDQAVCGYGKSYAKKPMNFDASMASTALANPAGEPEYSAPSRGSRRAEESAALEEAILLRKRQDENERQRQLASVYKKYCASAASSQNQGSSYKEVDTPDMLRLG